MRRQWKHAPQNSVFSPNALVGTQYVLALVLQQLLCSWIEQRKRKAHYILTSVDVELRMSYETFLYDVFVACSSHFRRPRARVCDDLVGTLAARLSLTALIGAGFPISEQHAVSDRGTVVRFRRNISERWGLVTEKLPQHGSKVCFWTTVCHGSRQRDC